MDIEMRELIEKLKDDLAKEAYRMRALNKELPVSGERKDLFIQGRTINIVYYPAEKENAPLIIGYHGGGYLFGGNAMNDKMWRSVQKDLDVNIASVEYRKSPDHKWKEALDDAYGTAYYLYEHSSDFGFDKKHIWVMGGSAGAGLAASVCLYAKQKNTNFIEKQILMYPFVDLHTDPVSKGEGSLQGPIMYVFNEMHCEPEETKLPLVSPVFAEQDELKGLPDAIICLADYDNLKHEGFQYAENLKNAGVKVQTMQFKDMPHGFFECGFGENFEGEFNFFDNKTKSMIESGEIEREALKALSFIKAALGSCL